MKRTWMILLSFSLALSLVACGVPDAPSEPTSEATATQATQPTTTGAAPTQGTIEATRPSSASSVSDAATEGEGQPMKIRLTANGETAVVELLDNDAAADLLSMLPLTLTFEDYNGIEKIATLPRELHIGSAPTSCDPTVGSFAYYAPWGNLSVFYQDFRESNSLIPLGVFESGIDLFAGMNGECSVTIEWEENR